MDLSPLVEIAPKAFQRMLLPLRNFFAIAFGWCNVGEDLEDFNVGRGRVLAGGMANCDVVIGLTIPLRLRFDKERGEDEEKLFDPACGCLAFGAPVFCKNTCDLTCTAFLNTPLRTVVLDAVEEATCFLRGEEERILERKDFLTNEEVNDLLEILKMTTHRYFACNLRTDNLTKRQKGRREYPP